MRVNYILPALALFMKYGSTPTRAGRLSAQVLIKAAGQTEPRHGSLRMGLPRRSAL